jgi:hypothetical protein
VADGDDEKISGLRVGDVRLFAVDEEAARIGRGSACEGCRNKNL